VPTRLGQLLLLAALALVAGPTSTAAAATCSDYPNQAAAQHAHDTRDSDHDGIYCESLPCPCSRAGGSNPPPQTCTRPQAVQKITFSKTKYPNIRRHFLDALRRGWPRILVLNRPGADARRDHLLSSYPTRPGYDRD
jgi:hypothetical protein